MADPVQPVRLNITTRSGKVKVFAAPGNGLSIDGGAVVNESDGSVDIRRRKSSGEIVVHCEPATNVTIGTGSGNVRTDGELGDVRVASVSGKVHIDTAHRVDVRTKSGDVEIGTVTGECRLVVTSAKVHVGAAPHAAIAGVSGTVIANDVERADVKTVSGTVQLSTKGASRVSVRTVSGTVEISIPPDVRPTTRLRSLSGKVSCDCERGSDGEIAVATVSGTIRVSCS
jgi:DUF4097 and DUF4098 domain-containing protein YvlB